MAEFNLQIGIDASDARRGGEQVKRSFRDIMRSARQSSRALKQPRDELGRFQKKAKSTIPTINALKRSLGGLFAGIGVAALGREIIQASDAFTQVENRLRLVTSSEQELTQVQAELIRQSKESFVALESQVQVFQRVSKGAGEFGFTQTQALQATEALAKAVRLSGVDAQSASSALVQLGQGIAAGALRGQELNSVLEQTPRVADAIADALGVPVGKLKELGEAGAISVDKIIPGLIAQLGKLDEETKKLSPTFDEITTNIKTDFQTNAGIFNQVTGAVAGFGKGLNDVASSAIPAFFDALATLASSFITVSEQAGITADFILTSLSASVDAYGSAAEGVSFFGNAIENLKTPITSSFTALSLIIVDVTAAFRRIGQQVASVALAVVIGFNKMQLAVLKLAGQAGSITFKNIEDETKRLQDAFNQTPEAFEKINQETDIAKTKILQAKNAEKDRNKAIAEGIEQRRKALEVTREQIQADLANTRAGGRSGTVQGADANPFGIKPDDIAKFNAANDAAEAFRQKMEEIGQLAASGALQSAVDAATLDAIKEFEEAELGVSQSEIDSFNQANNAALAYEATLAQIAKIEATGKADADALAESRRKAKEEFDEATGVGDKYNDMLERAKDITESVLTPTEQYAKGLKELQDLLAEGLISDEVFERAKKQLEQASEQTTFLKDVASAAAEDIQGAFRDLFLEGTSSLDNFADKFGETLQTIAANFLANEAIKFLLGGNFDQGEFGGVLGGLGDLFTGGGRSAADSTPETTTTGEAIAAQAGVLTDSLTQGGQAAADVMKDGITEGGQGLGGFFANLFGGGGAGGGAGGGGGTAGLIGGIIGAFAGGFDSGGRIPSGQVGLVGERGPEIVGGPASVVSRATTAQMMGGSTEVVINNITDPKEAAETLNTSQGDKNIVNSITRNQAAIKRSLGLA